MKPWDPLNARQLGLLGRISEGHVISRAEISSLTLTMNALRNRGLVKTSRRADSRPAEITEAGRFYLRHGHHPSRPGPQARPVKAGPPGGKAAPPGKDARDKPGTVRNDMTVQVAPQALLSMVRSAGGSLTIPDPAPAVRAAWRRAIYAARHSGLPEAAALMHIGRDKGDLVIWLPSHARSPAGRAGAATPGVPAVQRPRFPGVDVPGQLPAVPHPVVVLVQHSPDLVQVSGKLLPRALRILQAIATETGRRGYDLIITDVRGHHHLAISADGSRCELRIKETSQKHTGHRPGPGSDQNRRPQPVPSGRIQLSLGQYGRSWTDGRRSKVEDRLGEVLAELDNKMTACQLRRARREHEQAERHDQWNKAMAAARDSFTYAYRRDYLLGQHNAWLLAGSLRQFCTAMDTSCTAPAPAWQHAVSQWLAWLRQYADSIDPALTPEKLSTYPFNPEPAPEDLDPYLDGWNPYSPGT